MGKETTIRISTALRDRLKKLGMKGETYEEIIERLLKITEENREKVESKKDEGD